jgi:plastocyanin
VDRFAHRRAALAALVLIPALWSCGGGSGNDLPNVAGPPPHDVEIVPDAANAGASAFAPSNVVISLGASSTITWFNADITGAYGGGSGTTHHLKADDGTTFDTGPISPGGVFTSTFSTPGTYTYHCEIHPSMTGTVTVNP